MSNLTAIFGSSEEKEQGGEKLLNLYWNRAELKKEFAEMRKEQYRLQARPTLTHHSSAFGYRSVRVTCSALLRLGLAIVSTHGVGSSAGSRLQRTTRSTCTPLLTTQRTHSAIGHKTTLQR